MKTFDFIKNSIQNLSTVGTVTRSSGFLSRMMVKEIDFNNATHIIELGAGDGVVTKEILKRMKPEAYLYAFEVNEKFIEQLRRISDPRLVVVEQSAEDVDDILQKHGVDEVDAVISALPFVIFSEEMRSSIISSCHEVMKNGAPFTQMHYSLLLRKWYKSYFGNVKTRFVPINIPPAFVLTSRKKQTKFSPLRQEITA